MPNHVWGYWDCPYCGTRGIRGDVRFCPNCGIQIPDNTHFYVDNSNMQYVSEQEKDTQAYWLCDYCNTQNKASDMYCGNCGSPRSDATKDYFGYINQPPPQPQPMQVQQQTRTHGRGKLIAILCCILPVLLIVIGWLASPVTRKSEVEGFEWQRSIAVEQFRNVEESDWTLPNNANLHYTNQEISHYVQVLDHYETRTREVAHQELDGYDTEYRDLGNGQFEEVQTPRYKTVYETETYEEPVYRSDPVYETKYYYDIDKWIPAGSLDTSGSNHSPYWHETTLTDTVDSPVYGSMRTGARTESYYVVIKDKKGKTQKISYPLEKWEKLSVGDKIEYKTRRFSNEPIND